MLAMCYNIYNKMRDTESKQNAYNFFFAINHL